MEVILKNGRDMPVTPGSKGTRKQIVFANDGSWIERTVTDPREPSTPSPVGKWDWQSDSLYDATGLSNSFENHSAKGLLSALFEKLVRRIGPDSDEGRTPPAELRTL